MPPHTTLHLRTGLYVGPVTLGAGARLEGHGEVVLTSERGVTVTAGEGAELVHLRIQGGELGLLVPSGEARVSEVRWSGQRRRAVEVGGTATLTDVELDGTVEGIDGVVVMPGASATITGLSTKGGLRRAVSVEQGTLTLQDAGVLGAKVAVHAVDSTVRLEHLSVTGGSGPAVLAAAGSMTISGLEVRGHEYGVQAQRGAVLVAREVRIEGTAQACLSTLSASVTVEGLTASRCGLSGGIISSGGSLTVRNATLVDLEDSALLARETELEVDGVRVERVSSSGAALGDALHLRGGVARVRGLVVEDVEGSALNLSVFAQARVETLESARARASALFVERGAQLEAETVSVRGGGGPAVLVPDRAVAQIRWLSVSGGGDVPIYAECSAGAVVRVGRVESTVTQPQSPCISRLPAASDGGTRR